MRVELGEIDQLLAGVGVVGDGREAGGTGSEDGDGDHGHGSHEPVAHSRGAPLRTVRATARRAGSRIRYRDRTGR
ncbi:hypothetical protein GCM10010211_03280 [Streptomyces albospinus]|uniref:Uncharacterized protein n=1 Tax=Streptomyces albospinus TaxID=285515 RepID=A0ABQ2ULN1_9ACTN|nr:hypothetical protein GCM10010211_03280 [Streptomyces albospinus]